MGRFAVTLILAALTLPAFAMPASGSGPNAGADWGTFTFSMHGEAGDWVLIYEPLPGSPTVISTDYAYNVTTHPAGDDYAVTFLRPSVIFDTSGKGFREGTQLIEMKGNDSFHPDFGGGESAFTNVGTLAGVAMFFGATVPWDLNLTYSINDAGPILVQPSFPHGHGMTFQRAESAPVLDGDLARRADLDTTIDTAGWTMLTVERTYPEPVGVAAHKYDVAFPNGYSYGLPGVSVNERPPFPLPGGMTKVDDPDVLGAQTDAPGPFHATVTQAGLGSSLVLRLAHFPMEPEDMPADLNPGNYTVP